MPFVKAQKTKVKLRLWMFGPSGSGKSYGALRICKGLGGKTAMINTELGRGELYADKFDYDIKNLKAPFTVEKYLEAIDEAVKAGYDNIIVDSVSHEWVGRGGLLEKKGLMDERGGNQYTNWNKPAREHNSFLEAITLVDANIMCTARAKSDYVLVLNEKGKQEPKKMGLAPIQRPDMEFEFMLVLEVGMDHMARASKDNTGMWADGEWFEVTEDVGKRLNTWKEDGVEPVEEPVYCVRCKENGKDVVATKGSRKESGDDYCADCLKAWREYDRQQKAKAKKPAPAKKPEVKKPAPAKK